MEIAFKKELEQERLIRKAKPKSVTLKYYLKLRIINTGK